MANFKRYINISRIKTHYSLLRRTKPDRLLVVKFYMNINTIGVVQARMASSRLPNKTMLHLHGYPIIEWVFHRVSKAKLVDKLIFAIPDNVKDDPLAHYLGSRGALLFRGSEIDVLDRVYCAVKDWNPKKVVHISADNPFVTWTEIDRLIDFFNNTSCDYAYNLIPKGNRYPDGLGAMIASFELLLTVHREAKLPEHREHVFKYVWDNSVQFRICTFDPSDERLMHPELRLDIDTYEDYLKLLKLKVNIEMRAHEIVAAALDET